MAKLLERGELFAVDLLKGNIKIKIHEGFFKHRIIELYFGSDREFLRKLAKHLKAPIGVQEDGTRHHLGDVFYFGDKLIDDHKVTILIE